MKNQIREFGTIATAMSGESFRRGDASHRADAVRRGEASGMIQLAIRFAS